MNAEDGTAYRDDLHSEIPNSCSGETYLASDSVGSLRGPDNIDSPLFGSDSSPSSPPSSPSSPSSPPPSPVTAATAPFENEMPIVVVDKKRKLEVHISDPEYERLPGAEIVKVTRDNIADVKVIVETDNILPVNTLSTSIHVCFACYYIFNIYFPPSYKHILLFLEKYVYGLKSSQKLPMSVVLVHDGMERVLDT